VRLAALSLAAALSLFAPVIAPARADAPSPSPPASPAAPLAPIAGEWLQAESDLGYVSPPTGSTEPRPIVVAVHGMGDRPEWECAAWRAVFGPRPFIVCPRGSAWHVNFAWTSGDQIRRSIDAILDAASAHYGAHLDRAHRVYAGFSQGAILGPHVLKSDPHTYSYAIFQEGFDDALAGNALGARLHESGLTRVLLGCSQAGCAGKRVPVRAALERAGIEARLNDAGPRGHRIDDVIIRSVKRDLPWLLAGDDAWSAIVSDVSGG